MPLTRTPAEVYPAGSNAKTPEIVTLLDEIYTGAVSGGIRAYETKVLIDADLVPADGVIAYVTEDGANNGQHRKSGATGVGSWVKFDDLPDIAILNEVIAARGTEANLDDRLDTIETAATADSAAWLAADAVVTSAFVAADAVVTAAHIAADVVVTSAFVAADAVEVIARDAAILVETNARTAADTALDVKFLDLYGATADERPGDAFYQFTSDLTGAGSAAADLGSWAARVDNADGRTVRIAHASGTIPHIVARRDDFALELGVSYSGRWACRRAVNTSDPLGDTVEEVIQWLDSTKAAISETIVNTGDLVTADGIRNINTTFSRDQATTITAPSTARYARLFYRVYGGTGSTDISVIEAYASNGLTGPAGAQGDITAAATALRDEMLVIEANFDLIQNMVGLGGTGDDSTDNTAIVVSAEGSGEQTYLASTLVFRTSTVPAREKYFGYGTLRDMAGTSDYTANFTVGGGIYIPAGALGGSADITNLPAQNGVLEIHVREASAAAAAVNIYNKGNFAAGTSATTAIVVHNYNDGIGQQIDQVGQNTGLLIKRAFNSTKRADITSTGAASANAPGPFAVFSRAGDGAGGNSNDPANVTTINKAGDLRYEADPDSASYRMVEAVDDATNPQQLHVKSGGGILQLTSKTYDLADTLLDHILMNGPVKINQVIGATPAQTQKMLYTIGNDLFYSDGTTATQINP